MLRQDGGDVPLRRRMLRVLTVQHGPLRLQGSANRSALIGHRANPGRGLRASVVREAQSSRRHGPVWRLASCENRSPDRRDQQNGVVRESIVALEHDQVTKGRVRIAAVHGCEAVFDGNAATEVCATFGGVGLVAKLDVEEFVGMDRDAASAVDGRASALRTL
jgi:hypothetical protein